MHDDSVSLRKRTTPQHIHKWMDRTIRSLKDLDDFMSEIEFFKQNPAFRYVVINNFLQMDFKSILAKSLNESPFAIYNAFREKFGSYLGEYDVLVSALCAALNTQQKRNAFNLQKFNKFVTQSRGQVKKFNQFAAAANKRIAELEAEVKRLQTQN